MCVQRWEGGSCHNFHSFTDNFVRLIITKLGWGLNYTKHLLTKNNLWGT
jgi:hypothetical protein